MNHINVCSDEGFEIKQDIRGYYWAAKFWVEDGKSRHRTAELAAKACCKTNDLPRK